MEGFSFLGLKVLGKGYGRTYLSFLLISNEIEDTAKSESLL